MSIKATRARTIDHITRERWDSGIQGSTGLRYDFLRLVEESRINDLRHDYVSFEDASSAAVGRANLYTVRTDLTTMDASLPEPARAAIKRWYPGFMAFDVVECGLFTMIGGGVEILDPDLTAAALTALTAEMERVCREDGAELLLIRDVPAGHYNRFKAALLPLGFRPVLGFPNAVLDITWRSLDEYLASHDSGARYKLKTSLRLEERYGVTVEVARDYAHLAPVLARLWRNVNRSASEYSREQLDERFFATCSETLAGRSEVVLFRHRGEVVAFMLNLIGDEDYIMLDWGVDYDFEHYRTANLYRAASVLSVAAAIERGKKRLELGITNYTPKLLLGARIEPLVYFIRHRDDAERTNAVARLMTGSIRQPEISALAGWEERVRRDQDDLGDDDVLQKASRYHRISALRLGGIYGLYPEFKTAQLSSVSFDDQRGVVLLGTNSYLGLATHPEVMDAAKRAIDRYGTGVSGSPLLNGTLDIHNELERELARFVGKEAAVLCSTGYQANLTALSALGGEGDLVILDQRSHRSLFDGVKLSGVDFVVYRHNDVEHLERVLERSRGRRRLVVTESVFSMEGTVAPLDTICALSERYGARLYVDESHALGVLGPGGRGGCALHGVLDRVDLVMGTFSKSLAALGGFVAGSRRVIDFIKHTGSGHIFSAGLPPPVVAAVRAALRVVEREPERRSAVLERAATMAASLQALGYQVAYHGAPIVPIRLGNYTLALAAYKQLMGRGVYVNPVGPPAVPEEHAGFRTSYMATHAWEDLDRAIGVFKALRDEMRIREG